ncbi:hypothetical protein [Candidatus Methanocrinis natronophilus]|uniref:Curlin associated repeat-containing protein n=1 Tax=Candidatus Methanocrinis natronophilus TaxID=3033396 RepID=A0ABT5X5T1_9EURY|nr:hypothetical protein [Candidatus Methanocrinis natronophilus]MDF0590056.1 hypothetical protein [Candidatus Methanocrinis natronophilus]
MKMSKISRWTTALLVVLLAASSSSLGYANTVSQSISMNGQGGYVSQSSSSSVIVYGSNNYVSQSVTQNAQGNYITQSAANAAVVVGDGNTVHQGVHQNADGSYIMQAGANAVAVVGDNNDVYQDVSQTAVGDDIFQTGWNSGTIIGDANSLTQTTFASARTRPAPHADPVQDMSNFAYIAGSYNDVGQSIIGYAFVATGDGPIIQGGRNVVQTPDPHRNSFRQGISFSGHSGPGSLLMQSAQNEVRIG